MKVLEVIQRSTEFLEKKGVDSPRLQAELLLAHVLKLGRMQLYLEFERTLAENELDSYRELIRRRSQREPLQQITGSTSFCGYEIAVNRQVLVPRPETELLAEKAWTFLGGVSSVGAETSSNSHYSPAVAKDGNGSSNGFQKPQAGVKALDFGTGSGCLAIAMAARCPTVEVYALELSPGALELARRNAQQNGVADRIRFVQGDGLAALEKGTQFKLIVGNPPYIPSTEIATLQPEVRDYEPRLALDGGVDGLDYYRRLAAEAGAFLESGGKLMLEFGDGQAQSLPQIFQQQNWIVEAVVEDYTQRPRILIARKLI